MKKIFVAAAFAMSFAAFAGGNAPGNCGNGSGSGNACTGGGEASATSSAVSGSVSNSTSDASAIAAVVGSGNSTNWLEQSAHGGNGFGGAGGAGGGGGNAQAQGGAGGNASAAGGSAAGGNAAGGNATATGNGSGNATTVVVKGAERSAPSLGGAVAPVQVRNCRVGIGFGGSNANGAFTAALPLGNDATCLAGAALEAMEVAGGFSQKSKQTIACTIEGMEALDECKALKTTKKLAVESAALLP